MFSNPEEQFVRVFQQNALEEEQGDVVVKSLDEDNVFIFEREARFAPFDLLNEAATPSKLLQGGGFLGVLMSWVLHRGMAH